MERYQQTIEYMYQQLPMFSAVGAGAYKPGLDNALALSAAFGNPHVGLKCIHVGGTNGKGSTSHALASVLQEAGYKVGLYTSPHINDFRERIRINGEMISHGEVVDFMDRYQAIDFDGHPTFFELTTIMAFEHFKRHEVDYAVIEVGLGGRLDTTNIIIPVVSVITNVSLDHVDLLGNTPQAIASEKAGIIKECVPVVVGESNDQIRPVFEQKAELMHAPIIFADDRPLTTESDLQGDWQPKNINTVLHVVEVMRERGLAIISDDALQRGMMQVHKNTGLRGRWMRLGSNPDVICDSGHNIGAWEYLGPRLSSIARTRTLRMVIGFVKDKDVASIMSLAPKEAIYYLVAPPTKRALDIKDLLKIANDNMLPAKTFPSVKSGYDRALDDALPDDMVYVGGSNYVLAEILT